MMVSAPQGTPAEVRVKVMSSAVLVLSKYGNLDSLATFWTVAAIRWVQKFALSFLTVYLVAE